MIKNHPVRHSLSVPWLLDKKSYLRHSQYSHEQFGNRGAKQAQQILEQAAAMFAGGELSDEDKTAFMDEIQSLYLDSKRRAKKFTPKKYLDAK